LFFTFTQCDRRPSVTDNQAAAHLFFTGPIPGRKDDLGFAVAPTTSTAPPPKKAGCLRRARNVRRVNKPPKSL
jgi:hypothetical protein